MISLVIAVLAHRRFLIADTIAVAIVTPVEDRLRDARRARMWGSGVESREMPSSASWIGCG